MSYLFHKNKNKLLPNSNNTEIFNKSRTGPKAISKYQIIALKHILVQKFYKEERIYTKYRIKEDFYKSIGEIEDIEPRTFKNNYNKIAKENLEIFHKNKPALFKELVDNNYLKDHPLALNYAKKLISDR